MNKMCHLDSRRVCNNSCIAYEPGGGCRAGGGHSGRRRDYDELGLKEV
jgi:hypothetical protein